MKKNLLLFLLSCTLFIAADAQERCQEDIFCFDKKNVYAKILGGFNFLQNTSNQGNHANYEEGYIFAGSLGYSWCYGLSLEAEYAYRRNEIRKIHFFNQGSSKSGHFRTSSYMANLVWNMPLNLWECEFWNLRPMIGVGIGYDCQHMHASNSRVVFDQSWSQFSWQLMAGLAYPIFCNTDVTLEYKFHQGGCRFYNHSVGVGLIYKFGLR